MKEFWLFAKWQWAKWETWQKLWILGMFFLGAGSSAEPPVSMYLLAVPMAIFGGYMAKWFFWDGPRSAWQSYKKEKAELFQTIKEGK